MSFQNLPLAPRDTAWNATVAGSRLLEAAGGDLSDSTAQAEFRRGFLWMDTPEPEKPESYKWPIADVVEGELRAVPRAIFAAAAALKGDNGHPAQSRDELRDHLERYYEKMRDEFEERAFTPPWERASSRVEELRRKVVDAANDGIEQRRVKLDEVEMRATEGGGYELQGHAAVFDSLSDQLGGVNGFREKLRRGSFKRVLNHDVRLLVNHDQNRVLARTASGTLRLAEDPRGLVADADVADTSYARDLRVLLERGDVNQMSFGFRVGEDSWDQDEEGTVIRTIHRVSELYDVSVVTFPAYPQTGVGVRTVCGVPVTGDDGSVLWERLEELAYQIHWGERESTADERSALDALYSKTKDGVSPWMAQRALVACSREHELRGVIPGKHAAVVLNDAVDSSLAYRRELRRRRLALLA